MKKLTLSLCAAIAMASAAYAGETYSKESKSVAPPPCPQWYADNEFNLTLSGAYVWTGNDWRAERSPDVRFQRRLVVLDGQEIVASPLDHRLAEVPPGEGRVAGDRRPFE